MKDVDDDRIRAGVERHLAAVERLIPATPRWRSTDEPDVGAGRLRVVQRRDATGAVASRSAWLSGLAVVVVVVFAVVLLPRAIGDLVAVATASPRTAPSSGPSGSPVEGYVARFDVSACPDSVTAGIPNEVSCGFLIVPEDRARPNGRTIRVFVTRIQPPSGDPAPDPAFNLFVGWEDTYEGMAPAAERVDRELILMSARGGRYSEPSLACPEIQVLTDPASGVVLGSPAMEARFLDAVGECHDRLVGEGIDLGAYNLAEIAADAEDLRITLGIEEWNLATGSTSSSAAFEMMRRNPEHIRAAWIDSPEPPQVDRFDLAITATEHTLGQVAEACAVDAACAAAYRDIRGDWDAALQRIDDQRSLVVDEGLAVEVDAATAVRYLRKDFLDPGRIPLALRDLSQHGWLNDGPAGTNVNWIDDPLYSVGYGRGEGVLTHGAFYSTLCHDEMPFVDRRALAGTAVGKPWYVEAYADSIYRQVCDRWDVGSAVTDPRRAVLSDIPTLILVGRFDPFSSLPLVEEAVRTMSSSFVVEFPAWSHNVLATDCGVAIRNEWIADPSSLPDTSCIQGMPGVEFALPPPDPSQP